MNEIFDSIIMNPAFVYCDSFDIIHPLLLRMWVLHRLLKVFNLSQLRILLGREFQTLAPEHFKALKPSWWEAWGIFNKLCEVDLRVLSLLQFSNKLLKYGAESPFNILNISTATL